LEEQKKELNDLILLNRKKIGYSSDLQFRKRMYGNIPKKQHHSRVISDYQEFFSFKDDIYSSSAHSGDNNRPDYKELEMAANERVGVGSNFTTMFARKCGRNWFDLFDWDGNYVRKKRIMKNLYKANFFTEYLQWMRYELIYGTSFLWKIWTSNDSKKLDTKPPNTPPRAYKAIPVSYLHPTNLIEGQTIWDDDTKWSFYGGKYRAQKIHQDRIEVLNTRPNPNEWMGYSILEPIWLSISAYFNLIVNSIKMISKFSNVVVAFTMGVPNPSKEMYDEYAELIESMKANFTFVLGQGETLEFIDTKAGKGLMEIGEFFKEDMAAGTGLPLNQVYGRAEGGGLQGAGALVSKQTELETTANYQADVADNIWYLLNQYWDVEDLFVKFRLESQKTDLARYEEEGTQWDNEIRKAQWEGYKLDNLMKAMNFQMRLENPQLMFANQGMNQAQGQTGIGSSNQGQVANQSGAIPIKPKNGNGVNKKTTSPMQQVQKINKDFINHQLQDLNFTPRVIDAEFVDRELDYKKFKRGRELY